MTDGQKFAGEDENAGFASPVQDLIAAAFLVLLSVWIMIESLRLDIPGSLVTAPGLLPFFTSASLCAMALGLGSLALRRHRNRISTVPLDEKPDHLRAAMLVCLIGVYLVCLQLISFEYAFQIGEMRLGYGAFEVLTTIALTAILSVFWGQALWSCVLVSLVWVTLLAGVFRYVFTIPLPGSA